MADTVSKEKRSWMMSRVKGKNTKPEMLVRRFLHTHGFRYRLHAKDLPGSPDIVLPKYKTVIFVHGCFWHGHEGCSKAGIPKTRTEWWKSKIDNNVARDTANVESLKESGWNVVLVWQCGLKNKVIEATLKEVVAGLYTRNSESIKVRKIGAKSGRK